MTHACPDYPRASALAPEPAEGRLGGLRRPEPADPAAGGRDVEGEPGGEGQARHLPAPVRRAVAHRHVRHEARRPRRHPRRVQADRLDPARPDRQRAPARVREGDRQVRPGPVGPPPDEEPQLGDLLQPDRPRPAARRHPAPRHAGALPGLRQHGRQAQAGRRPGDPDVRLVPARPPRRERHARPDGELPRQAVRPVLRRPGPERARLPPARAEPARRACRSTGSTTAAACSG